MSFESTWTYDKLWYKARVYIEKALVEDSSGIPFAFQFGIHIHFVFCLFNLLSIETKLDWLF